MSDIVRNNWEENENRKLKQAEFMKIYNEKRIKTKCIGSILVYL